MCVLGRVIRDFIPVHPNKYLPHPTWRDVLEQREEALRNRHMKVCERLTERTKTLQTLHVGDTFRIQNQVGLSPNKWDRTGVVAEVLPYDQYGIRVDGSGRVTVRNRKFLRKYTAAARPTNTSVPVEKLRFHNQPEQRQQEDQTHTGPEDSQNEPTTEPAMTSPPRTEPTPEITTTHKSQEPSPDAPTVRRSQRTRTRHIPWQYPSQLCTYTYNCMSIVYTLHNVVLHCITLHLNTCAVFPYRWSRIKTGYLHFSNCSGESKNFRILSFFNLFFLFHNIM